MKKIIAAVATALLSMGLMATPTQAIEPGDKMWTGELKVSADPIRGLGGSEVKFKITWKFPDPKHRVKYATICDNKECYDKIPRKYWHRTKYGWRVTFPAYIPSLDCYNNVSFTLYAMRKYKKEWNWSSFAMASIPVVCNITSER